MVYAIDYNDKVFWNAYGRRYVQGRAGFGNISDRAFELRRFITDDNKGCLQHTPAHAATFFVHLLSLPVSIQVRRQISISGAAGQRLIRYEISVPLIYGPRP